MGTGPAASPQPLKEEAGAQERGGGIRQGVRWFPPRSAPAAAERGQESERKALALDLSVLS